MCNDVIQAPSNLFQIFDLAMRLRLTVLLHFLQNLPLTIIRLVIFRAGVTSSIVLSYLSTISDRRLPQLQQFGSSISFVSSIALGPVLAVFVWSRFDLFLPGVSVLFLSCFSYFIMSLEHLLYPQDYLISFLAHGSCSIVRYFFLKSKNLSF